MFHTLIVSAMVTGFSIHGIILSYIATTYYEDLKIDGFCESMGLTGDSMYVSADCQRSNNTMVIKFVCPPTQILHTDVVENITFVFYPIWLKVNSLDCSLVLPLNLSDIEPKGSYQDRQNCKALTYKHKAVEDNLFTTFNNSLIISSVMLGVCMVVTAVIYAYKYGKRWGNNGRNEFKYDLRRFTKEVDTAS